MPYFVRQAPFEIAEVLVETNSVSLKPDTTHAVLFDIAVSLDAKPGRYTGELRIESAGSSALAPFSLIVHKTVVREYVLSSTHCFWPSPRPTPPAASIPRAKTRKRLRLYRPSPSIRPGTCGRSPVTILCCGFTTPPAVSCCIDWPATAGSSRQMVVGLARIHGPSGPRERARRPATSCPGIAWPPWRSAGRSPSPPGGPSLD